MSLSFYDVVDTLPPEFEKYTVALETAGAAIQELDDLLNSNDFQNRNGWKKEVEGENGEIVYTTSYKKGKILVVKTEVPVDIEIIFKEMWDGVDSLPEWNQNIQFAKKIAAPTEHFDIVNYGNTDLFVITGRELLISRVWRELPDGGYLLASRSIELPEFPERKDKVRGEVFLGGLRIKRHPTKPNIAVMDAVMHGDAKGMIPKFLINPVLPKIALQGARYNRERFLDLAQKAQS